LAWSLLIEKASGGKTMATQDEIKINKINNTNKLQQTVFDAQEIEARWVHMQAAGATQEQGVLLAIYERMLRRGGARTWARPLAMPDMEGLYEALPNFAQPLDEVKRQVALGQDSDEGLSLMPMLLLGPPGIGKTHFARQLADLLGTQSELVSMNAMTAGWLLSGSSPQWKGSKPGRVFQALAEGDFANPVMVLDEIDKTSADAQYDPLGPLYNLLEVDTASRFVDEFVDVRLDARHIIWIATANDDRHIPAPILNRMNVWEIAPPSVDQARGIASRLCGTILAQHQWGRHFDADLSDDVLGQLALMPPRDMRRSLMTAFGNARLARRERVIAADLPLRGATRQRMGFVA
jgi:ATP-dependent Lon protease